MSGRVRAALVRPAAVALVAAGALACGPPPAPPAPPAPPPAPAAAGADLRGGAFGEVRSDRFGVVFSLPDARGWQVDDRSTPWLVARHDASDSTLLVRTWREDENATRERCEAKARLWRDLPRREGASVFERRRVDVPRGFDTRVDLGVVPSRAGAPVGGFALAFGGWARRCFAFVYTTSAGGAEAGRVLADRLAAMSEALDSVMLQSALSPAIPRQPGR